MFTAIRRDEAVYFADTFYWAALRSPDDRFYSEATVIPQSRDLLFAGLELYQGRPDKGYSLTNCISMQIMGRAGLRDVLTNDRHFEQEGFRAVFGEG